MQHKEVKSDSSCHLMPFPGLMLCLCGCFWVFLWYVVYLPIDSRHESLLNYKAITAASPHEDQPYVSWSRHRLHQSTYILMQGDGHPSTRMELVWPTQENPITRLNWYDVKLHVLVMADMDMNSTGICLHAGCSCHNAPNKKPDRLSLFLLHQRHFGKIVWVWGSVR